MPVFRTVLGLALVFLIAACSTTTVPRDARTTVLAFRHADRAAEELNSTGIARAAALPAAVQDYTIDAIYSPDIARNLDTAAPLSKALGMPVTIINKEGAAARMVRDHPQGTVIWIGNKGNLRTLWEDLSAPGPAPQDYGELFVVELQSLGRRKVTRLFVSTDPG